MVNFHIMALESETPLISITVVSKTSKQAPRFRNQYEDFSFDSTHFWLQRKYTNQVLKSCPCAMSHLVTLFSS